MKVSEKITTIILDWAGTTVDFGCFAPVNAFISAFEAFGLSPTMEETRAPMGLSKRTHIEKMLAGKRLAALWEKEHGRAATQKDVDLIYDSFEPKLFLTLDKNADIIPGVREMTAEMKNMGVKIGSTTGYTKAMMEIVTLSAQVGGYAPDSLVCPDETGGIGRPFPYMLWRNLEILGVSSINNVVKIGDTAADIKEGKNAGCVTVGVIKGSSMLGLSLDEYEVKAATELSALFEVTRQKYFNAGADYVIESIVELSQLILTLNKERG